MPAIEQEACDMREAVAVAIELECVDEFQSDDSCKRPCNGGAYGKRYA